MMPFILAASLLFAAEPDSSSPATTEVARPDSFLLRLRFEPGHTARYSVRTDKEMSFDGSTMKTVEELTLMVETMNASHDSAELRFTFEQIRWNIDDRNGNRQFDSQKKASRYEQQEFATLRQLIGASYLATLNGRGKVQSIRVAPPKLDADNQANEKVTPRGPTRDQTDMVAEKMLRDFLIRQYSWVPDEPIALDHTWTREESVPMGICELTRKNTLVAHKLKDDRLTIDSQIEITGKPSEGVTQGDIRVTGEVLPGKPGKAQIVFNPQNGMLESLVAEVDLNIRLRSAAPNSENDPNKLAANEQRSHARTEVRLIDPQIATLPVGN